MPTPGTLGTERQTTPGMSQTRQPGPQQVEIWPNTHFVFYPAVSGNRKRKRQATPAEPDSEMMSTSDSKTSSTVDTLTLEGKDGKDFIIPDYPSDELTSSQSSESEPEEAPAENLSTGWSERVTRVDIQFHGDHVGPQNITDHINQPSQRAAPWPTISDSLAIGRN